MGEELRILRKKMVNAFVKGKARVLQPRKVSKPGFHRRTSISISENCEESMKVNTG